MTPSLAVAHSATMSSMTNTHGATFPPNLDSTLTARLCASLASAPTNLSPQDTAAWLNEAALTDSRSRGTLHGNARRAYPFWKTCRACSGLFVALTKEQAVRAKSCSPACKSALLSAPRAPRGRDPACWVDLTCLECGSEFSQPRSWAKKPGGGTFCSRACSGAVRARALVRHPRHGEGSTAPEAIAKRASKMRGASNPAWKGGVTLVHRKGNYPRRERLVRCPPELASMARKNGYVLEHRLVVARAVGRPLTRAEAVHHIDHEPTNNDAANLMLFASNRDHKLYEAHGSPPPIWSGSSASTTAASSGA